MGIVDLRIRKRDFLRFQVGAVALVLTLGCGNYVFAHLTGHRRIRVLDLGAEASLPSYFSTFNLLVTAVLLFLVSRAEKSRGSRTALHWTLLAAMFAYLSADEGAAIHESFGPIHRGLGLLHPVFAHHEWLPFGIVLASIAGAFFVPFLRSLDRRTAAGFVLAGTTFLSGAIGFELLGGWLLYADLVEYDSPLYLLRRVLEEGFEMLGIVIMNVVVFETLGRGDLNVCVSRVALPSGSVDGSEPPPRP